MSKKRATRHPKVVPPMPSAPPAISAPYHLADLFLSDASVSRPGVKEGAPPQHLTVTLEFGGGGVPDKPDHLAFIVKHNAEARYDLAGEPAIKIQANFVILYKFPVPFEGEIPQDVVKEFGEKQAVMHAWPYWREFVQSATSRMGLPILRMPLLFNTGMPFQEVLGQGDVQGIGQAPSQDLTTTSDK